jgi:RecA/RadA recombinase
MYGVQRDETGHKTTLAQHIVAECQKMGGTAVYVDMEHAVDLAYMAECGVDTSTVYFSHPDSGTDALNIVRKLVSSNTVDLIVVDSVAALTSAAELDMVHRQAWTCSRSERGQMAQAAGRPYNQSKPTGSREKTRRTWRRTGF